MLQVDVNSGTSRDKSCSCVSWGERITDPSHLGLIPGAAAHLFASSTAWQTWYLRDQTPLYHPVPEGLDLGDAAWAFPLIIHGCMRRQRFLLTPASASFPPGPVFPGRHWSFPLPPPSPPSSPSCRPPLCPWRMLCLRAAPSRPRRPSVPLRSVLSLAVLLHTRRYVSIAL